MSKMKPEKLRHIDRKANLSLLAFSEQLEIIAQKLKAEGTVTFKEGDKETRISPSQDVQGEYSYITQGSKHKFEIELKWNDDSDETFFID